MADYYPLIARAVAGLDKNTGDARRTLYERARAALVAQLRGVTPALDESDVTRERLSLEEAIRKVEGESARQSTSRSEMAGRVKAPEFPRWAEPEPVPEPAPEPEPAPRAPPPRRQAMPRPEGRGGAAPAPSARAKPEPRYVEPENDPLIPPDPVPAEPRQPQSRPHGRATASMPPSPRAKAEPRYVEQNDDPERQLESEGQEPPRAARPRPPSERGGDRRSLLDTGLRDLRGVVSEASELGAASARATKSARETYAQVPAEANRSQQRPLDSDDVYLTLDDIAEPVMLEPSFIVDESRPVPPRMRQQAPPAAVDRETAPRRSYADLIRVAIAVAIVGGIGGLLLWQWPNMVAIYGSLTAPSAEVAKDNNPPPASKPKIPDRIEPGGKSSQQPQDVAATVAQRVVLYEEDPNDPKGKSAVGSAVWGTEPVSLGAGKPPELQVRGNIEIPERKMSITWVLHRDIEPNSSSSHTIELNFKVPPGFPPGSISSVPGIWMKQAEQTQGTALAGFAVKVTPGYFLIGLSGLSADRERNVKLLKERPWIEIPIVYSNTRRAILAIEKGTPGERAFAQAFAAWEK